VAADGRMQRRGMALVVEGIVILASILAAFLLEGWRTDRELARDLTQELESVYRELERNRDLVSAELSVLDRLTSSAAALLVELHANPEAALVEATDTIALLATVWAPTFDPSLGAVDALISSGRLAQLPNPRLRQGLAGLRDQFQDAREEQVNAIAIRDNLLFPLTRDRLDYRAFRVILDKLAESGSAGAQSQESMAVRSFPSLGTVDYPNGPSIRSTLEFRRMIYLTVQDELSQLQVFLDDLIADLEDELANR
jgi:hypothetical protein